VLVERHQRLVFGVALARCRDPALAEDLTQEAFVAAWRDLDRLRDVERVGSWVAGIARNLASSASRDRARRQADSAVPVPSPALDEVPTPEDEVLEREDRELLRRALAVCPRRTAKRWCATTSRASRSRRSPRRSASVRIW
jgi:RNA polymerase sigma-70 factor, ECF subfamily